MNFQQLRIIRETVRHKFNLTDAANKLLTSQSGVSKHIRDLEEELGIEIFVRRGKRLLGLTEPGKAVVEITERMLLDADNLMRVATQFSHTDEGTITIATTHTQARYSLPSVIARFKAAYPDVRLVLNQASPKEIAAVLLEGHTDIGIATDTFEDHAGIAAFPYYAWDHAVIVPKGHELARRKPITLEAISEYPVITYDEGLTGRARIDQAFDSAGLVPDIAMSALDADVIKTYVELGLGVGIIASMAFSPERDHGLELIDCRHLFPLNTSSIAVRRGRFLRAYVYRFIELCSAGLSEDVVRAAAQAPARP